MFRKFWAWLAVEAYAAESSGWRKQRTANAEQTLNPERVASAVADEVHAMGAWEVWAVEHDRRTLSWRVIPSHRFGMTEAEAKVVAEELQIQEDEILARGEGGYVAKRYAAVRRSSVDEVWLA